jgi:hypothetical protein
VLATPGPSTAKVALGTAAGVVGFALVVKAILLISASKDVFDVGHKTVSWAKARREARAAKKEAEAKKNPLLLGMGDRASSSVAMQRFGRRSSTGGRTVAFRVQLGGDPYREAVVLRDRSRATLFRHGRPLVTFRASEYQQAKIRSGNGEILIFTDQI